ncbi:hypothetical protein quinque_004455 [Culex quinquefasciatus]
MVQRAKNCNKEELANALGDAISSSIPEVPIDSKMNARVASETSDDQESCGSLESSLDSSMLEVAALVLEMAERVLEEAELVLEMVELVLEMAELVLEVAALVLEMAERVLKVALILMRVS